MGKLVDTWQSLDEHLSSMEMRGVTPIPETGANTGITGCLTQPKIPALQYGSSYHATGVRERLRLDRSLPKRDQVPLWRKGSQVKQ